jgi:MFS family permease
MFLIAGSGVYTASAMTEFNAMHLLGMAFALESLARCFTVSLAGRLGQRVGRRQLFLAALAVYCAAAIICATATGPGGFITGRALMGLTWGLFEVNTFAMMADLYTARQATKRAGYAQALGLAAMLAAGPLTGLMSDHFSWRVSLWAALPLLVIAWLMVAAGQCQTEARSAARPEPIDLAGAVALAATLVPFSLAMAWGGSVRPWSSPAILWLLGLALAGAIGLVTAERRAVAPLLPARILRHRPFLVVLLIAMLHNMVAAAGNYLPAFAQSVLGTTATVSGLVGSPSLLTAAIMAGPLGRYLARSGRYRAVVVLWGVLLVAAGALFATFGAATAIWFIVLTSAVQGLAQGPMQVVPYTYPIISLPPDQVAAGIAVMAFAGVFANTLANGIFAAVANTGLVNVFKVSVLFALLALVVSLVFRDRSFRPGGMVR